MRYTTFAIAAILSLAISVPSASAQKLLKTDGWGSLTGKVTLDGAIPAIVNLVPKMKIHRDGPICCLLGKKNEKIDLTWVVDPKTKGVANVVVWVRAPQDTYLAIKPAKQKRKDTVIIDQPHCQFVPRVSVFNPVYFDGKKEVPTGQKLILRNSAVVAHNIRATAHPIYNEDNSFNVNVPAKSEITKTFNPQPLPVKLQCDFHTWMSAQLFVFNHPYYAITDANGNFTIPEVPAGAEIHIMAWHEGVGYVTPGGKTGGVARALKAGKNVIDFTVKAP
ncbi:MAG: hypothetical protein HYX68_21595 [Planctomycetes bacterium]|nr:hypothetical protein [Planctomycetota bacterium]